MSTATLGRLRTRAAALPRQPLVSIVMPVYETPERYLREAIASVRAQVYEAWELCICDDASRAPHIRAVLEAEAAGDARIKIARRHDNGRISRASNDALALATGEWVAMLDHDDVLRPHALFCMVEALGANPEAQILYSDEDKIDDAGHRFDPYFKPDFSIDLLLGQNYLNHLTMHRRANIEAVGGWRPDFDGSQDYDLTLRILERVGTDHVVHVPHILYHWRAAAGSTARAPQEKNYAVEAGLRALQGHANRVLPGARVEMTAGAPYYRIAYPLPAPPPLVSIIIPTRDEAAVLERCLVSLFERTDYRALDIIIVDNGSIEPDTFALFDRWTARHDSIRVLRDDRPFNYSALNNRAVREARGSLLCLLNNDIEAVEPSWLGEMVSLAVRPEVGCVGAKLLYPNGTLQHGGVILGIGGVAGHSHKYAADGYPGYFHQLSLRRTVSAVTAACLVVKASIFAEVGGLDEQGLAVAFNDVDFCLKVQEAGYRNVWTPSALLIHHESLSRGADTTREKQQRFLSEIETMRRRWGTILYTDPFYSPNLTLVSEDNSLAFPPRVLLEDVG
ncbi:glycosyltransferase family 2 protein [Phreatobacter aquaticus]|uniref:glycosyltransferase family 2 protein n=1 Tax=Phreatobacter aquaticus TaxID=2570229 RepID=UPI001C078463|nr:glycosyltransferase family 2 protein [Phreatobacter aquaticus]